MSPRPSWTSRTSSTRPLLAISAAPSSSSPTTSTPCIIRGLSAWPRIGRPRPGCSSSGPGPRPLGACPWPSSSGWSTSPSSSMTAPSSSSRRSSARTPARTGSATTWASSATGPRTIRERWAPSGRGEPPIRKSSSSRASMPGWRWPPSACRPRPPPRWKRPCAWRPAPRWSRPPSASATPSPWSGSASAASRPASGPASSTTTTWPSSPSRTPPSP